MCCPCKHLCAPVLSSLFNPNNIESTTKCETYPRLILTHRIFFFRSGTESLLKHLSRTEKIRIDFIKLTGLTYLNYNKETLNWITACTYTHAMHACICNNKSCALLHTLYLVLCRGEVSGGQRLLVHDWHRWNFLCNPWRDKDFVFARFLCHLSLAATVRFFFFSPFWFSSQGQMIQRCCHMTQHNE